MPSHVESYLIHADDELQRRVRSCLVERHFPSLRRVTIEVRDGVVTIRGRVPTYYEKQLCHSYTRHVPGVIRLVDEVEVTFDPPR